MDILLDPRAVSEVCRLARFSGMSLGFVPTMGGLHEGHLSLLRAARADCDTVVLSLFVNPTQFGPGEDFHQYPRTPELDLDVAQEAGVNLVFMPEAGEIYPRGFSTYVQVEGLGDRWEGEFRPGHFRGVATVVLKLLNIVSPDRLYVGRKDYQQMAILRRMVRDLDLPVELVCRPTVREPDGLALSTRNRYLLPTQRAAALCLPGALGLCRELLRGGERRAWELLRQGEGLIADEASVALDYLAVADPETLQPVDLVGDAAVILGAIRVGGTRLIDNLLWGEIPDD